MRNLTNICWIGMEMMNRKETLIDFHTHTFYSDGELSPMELVQRARINGYTVIGITDHADVSNLESVGKTIVEFAKTTQNYLSDITIIPGIELTHNLPELTKELVKRARKLEIPLVVVHGETPVEPVPCGTNRAAVEIKADILAHPGFISEEEIILAVENDVALEITSRRGHNITNGRLLQMARKIEGSKLVINSDTHAPGDLLTPEHRRKVGLGAGLSESEYHELKERMIQFAEKLKARIPWL